MNRTLIAQAIVSASVFALLFFGGVSLAHAGWASHTWHYKDGQTNPSYILDRTDSEYTTYIASIDAQCLLINVSQSSWKPNAGDSSASNWQNFGIPDCSGTATTSSYSSSSGSGGYSSSTSTTTSSSSYYYSSSTTTSSSSSSSSGGSSSGTADITPPTVVSFGSYTESDGRLRAGVSFSESMDSATLTGSNISIVKADTGERVSCTINIYYSGIDCVMGSPAFEGVEYQMTVKGVKDVSGNLLASEYTSVRFKRGVVYSSSGTSMTSTFSATTSSSSTSPSTYWASHTWHYKDGQTNSSYVLDRTDSEYTSYIASIDAQCLLINVSQSSWKPNAGDSSASNWQNFGIPDCSGTAATSLISTSTPTMATSTRSAIKLEVIIKGPLGEMIEGAALVLWSSRGVAQSSGKTDASGKVVFEASAGEFFIDITPPSYLVYIKPAPKRVFLVDGVSQTFAIFLEKGAKTVTGRVLFSDETGVPDAYVGAYRSDTGVSASAKTDSKGYYTLRLSGGRFRIEVHPQTEGTSWQSEGNAVEVIFAEDSSSETRTTDFTISSPNSSVVVSAVDGAGNPLEGARIMIDSVSAVNVNTLSSSVSRLNDSKTTDKSGHVTFAVPSNAYYLRGYAPSSDYFNPDEVQISVAPSRGASVSLAFKRTASVPSEVLDVSGKARLEDGSPAVGAFVYAWSEQGGYRSATALSDGSFAFRLSKKNRWHIGGRQEEGRIPYKSSEIILESDAPLESIDMVLTRYRDELLPKEVRVTKSVIEEAKVFVTDGAEVLVPANAASGALGGSVNISITPTIEAPVQAGMQVISTVYDVSIEDSFGKDLTAFSKKIEIVLPYTEKEIKAQGASESSLRPGYLDEKSGAWVIVDDYTIDTAKNVIIARINHLTRFAIVSAADIKPPLPPAALSAAPGSAGVILAWENPKSDFAHSKIYRSTKAGELGEVIAPEVVAATYTDRETWKGAAYYYIVRAIDPAGNESTNTTQLKTVGIGTGPKKITAFAKAPTTSAAALSGKLAKTLSQGARGADVKLLQEVLVREGFLASDSTTGYFGPLTKKAVIALQEKYKEAILVPAGLAKGSGLVGPLTRKKINTLLEGQ